MAEMAPATWWRYGKLDNLDPLAPEDAPELDAVARMLAGGAPPQPFVSSLVLLGIALKGFVAVEQRRVTRKEMRERLERVRDLATELRVTLFDPGTLAFIERGAEHFMQGHSSLLSMLQDVARRADKAAQAPRRRGGQDRAHVAADVPTAHSFCALVIAEAWQLMRHEEVKPSSGKAHIVAKALWLACGGTHDRQWGSTNAGWRRHFEAARLIADVHRNWVRSRLTSMASDRSKRPH